MSPTETKEMTNRSNSTKKQNYNLTNTIDKVEQHNDRKKWFQTCNTSTKYASMKKENGNKQKNREWVIHWIIKASGSFKHEKMLSFTKSQMNINVI